MPTHQLNFKSTNQTWTLKAEDAAYTGYPNSGQFSIYNGATKLWSITESGFVEKPGIPRFLAKFVGFNTTTTYVSPTYNSVFYNVGGHFNSSNGLFTCPYPGSYLFMASFLRNSTSVVFRGNYYLNGSRYGLGEYRTTEGFAGYNESSSLVGIIEADVGDYVEWRISSDSASSIYSSSNNHYNYFNGIFLG